MRPILYNANETAFETYGLGEIDATKAQVTRERNGNYTLYIEYPASGPLAGTFKNDMRIKSDAGLRTKNQTFFISRILKDSTGILKVYAKHISHLTEKMAIRNNTNVSGTAQAALAIWALNALGGIRFDTWSDIDLTSKTSWNIADFKTARDALGGVAGSILDVWGGEYEFDNTVIRLHKQLGRKSPIVLEYGRNILRAEDDQDIDGAYTSVYPYATYTPESQGTGEGGATSQQVTVELPEKYVDGPYIGLYNERRVLIVDFSSNFKDKEVPTIDKLRRLAKEYAINNRLGLPKINTKIEYVDLSKTLDYKLTQILEEAELCDIVPVYYPQIGLTSEDAKLTTIVYDVLLEQNDSVEVGVIGDGFKSSMTSNLSGKIDDLASNQQRLVNTLPDYLLNAQGNKVWYNRPDNSEHKVGDIWFEKNGLYDRMYVWNGSQWEKRIDTEDIDKVKKEVDKQISDAKISTNQAIAQANAKAEEALKKAGTLPDTSKLSDQIKQQILNSPDLQNKVTETLNQTDSGVIYNKILQNVKNEFVEQKDIGPVLAGINKKIQSQTVEFQKLTETNKLYERIIGTSETGAPDQLSRLVMSSQIFQTEVGKYVTDDNNLIVNSMTMDKNTLVQTNNPKVRVSLEDRTFSIYAYGLTSQNYTGFSLPIYVKKVYRGETYTLGFKYRFRYYPDEGFAFNIKNHRTNKILSARTIGDNRPPLNEWQEYQQTFTINDDFEFGEDSSYPFYVYLVKNGWVEFKEPILVRGSRTGPYKPSQFDDAYKSVEATRTQMTQLAGSWAVRNLNNNGDVLNSINVLADGNNRIDGRLTHITGQTQIDNAVIKDGMIANLNADKITGGTIDASKINVINIDAQNINAGILQGMTIRGGHIEAINGAMRIDLLNANTDYYQNATVSFWGDNNAIKRVRNGVTGFLHFADDEWNGVYAGLGVTSHNVGIDSSKTARFSGIKIWRSDDKHDKSEVYGDFITLKHEFKGNTGYNFQPAAATKMHNMTDLINKLEQFAGNAVALAELGQFQRDKNIINYLKWLNQRMAHLGNALGRKDIFYAYRGIGAVEN
nr:MAG TPA: tail protein [Caudoviricetes sp.]